jgi:hypothetical protein
MRILRVMDHDTEGVKNALTRSVGDAGMRAAVGHAGVG